MPIQWYPGHMHKAAKEVRKRLPSIDLIIEVLDARIPFSSENPMIHELRQDKPCLKVLSKSDLADPRMTMLWQQHMEQERGVKTLAITTEAPEKMRQLMGLCARLVPRSETDPRPVHALIMGIPNVGKSTLINTLAGRSIARTGNEPAVTKSQQRIELADDLVLFDTPGMLWPNVENRNSCYRLAATGAVK
jgi:ribosome biogenesis GTPase A